MAIAFQFHRINLPPLHLSYITFAILAVFLLPSSNKGPDYNGIQCYDLGAINVNADIQDKWHTFDDASKNSSHDDLGILRYGNKVKSIKNLFPCLLSHFKLGF